MPTYVLPPLKKRNKDGKDSPVAMGIATDEYMRRVRLPVSKAILAALEVGDKATVTLRGVVKGLQSEAREGQDESNTLELVVDSVEAYPDKGIENAPEDMDSYRRWRTAGGGS